VPPAGEPRVSRGRQRDEGVLAVDFGSRDPHNLGTSRIRSHCWSGVTVHCIQQQLLPGCAWHQLLCDRPILSIVVSEAGGHCEARATIDARTPTAAEVWRRQRVGHTSIIPAGVPIWGYSDGMAQFDEVRVILDIDRVQEVTGGEFPLTQLADPQLMFFDEPLQALARLLVASEEDMAGFVLFGDSLVTAMIGRLSQRDPLKRSPDRRLGLTKSQLSRVTEFMRDNVDQPIRLSALAKLAGLSASQFGRAFKVSTGTTPQEWFLDTRIECAKALLADPRRALVDIALDTGFSEQSHFSRAFRTVTGATPNAWRRSQRN
jgi:AraC family transcriptional regulator